MVGLALLPTPDSTIFLTQRCNSLVLLYHHPRVRGELCHVIIVSPFTKTQHHQ